MMRAVPDELLIFSMSSKDRERTIKFQDGDECEFHARFEDAGGIRVLVAAELSRWLIERGKLWALSQICDLLDGPALELAPEGPPLRLVSNSEAH